MVVFHYSSLHISKPTTLNLEWLQDLNLRNYNYSVIVCLSLSLNFSLKTAQSGLRHTVFTSPRESVPFAEQYRGLRWKMKVIHHYRHVRPIRRRLVHIVRLCVNRFVVMQTTIQHPSHSHSWKDVNFSTWYSLHTVQRTHQITVNYTQRWAIVSDW